MFELILALQLTVIDGDTFKQDGQSYRLAQIDAPEIKQRFGPEAKKRLTYLLRGKFDKKVLKKERYGRNLVVVTKNGKNVNLQLVEKGFAWFYYTKDPVFINAQSAAKSKKLGLWKDPNPTSPWDYRKKR